MQRWWSRYTNNDSRINRASFALLAFIALYALVAAGMIMRVPSFLSSRPPTIRGAMRAKKIIRGQSEIWTIPQSQQIFPVPINDYEEIQHPAKAYCEQHFPKDLPSTLLVPKFWNPPAYGGDVRHFLGSGIDLMTKVNGLSIGSFHKGHETIFISIASYRDPDCINTLESIYLRATYPDRIRTVIIEQRKEGDTFCTTPQSSSCKEDPDQVPCKYSHLIESYELEARAAVGPVFARHLGKCE
jgi:hypothetical protein